MSTRRPADVTPVKREQLSGADGLLVGGNVAEPAENAVVGVRPGDSSTFRTTIQAPSGRTHALGAGRAASSHASHIRMDLPVFDPVLDETQLRRAFSSFPSGVTAVCTRVDDLPVGVAASSFTTVSVEPPLVSVNMRHESTTWPLLRTGRRLGLSVLALGQEDICRRLAGDAVRRFEGTDWVGHADGGVFIEGATMWLDCSLHAEIPAGDHDVVLLRIHGIHVRPETEPLVFHGSRFRRLATT